MKNDPKMMENTTPVELKDEDLDNVSGGIDSTKAGITGPGMIFSIALEEPDNGQDLALKAIF